MPACKEIYADKDKDIFPMLPVLLKVNSPSLSCDCISGAATAERERGREREGKLHDRTVPYIAGINARKTLAKRAQIIKY